MPDRWRHYNMLMRNRDFSRFYRRDIHNHIHLLAPFLEEYWGDRGRLSNDIHARSHFWEILHAGVQRGCPEVLDFLFRNTEININNRRNQLHLNLLSSAFFGKKEETVLKLLDHPNIDINRPVLFSYHCVVNNYRGHPLVRAAEKGWHRVFDKLLSNPSLDINSQVRHTMTSTQRDMSEDNHYDYYYGKFSLLEQMLNKKPEFFRKFILHHGIEIHDMYQVYAKGAVGDSGANMDMLYERWPVDSDILRFAFQVSLRYSSGDVFPFFKKHLKEEIESCIEWYLKGEGECLKIYPCEANIKFYEHIFDYLPIEAHQSILSYETYEQSTLFHTVYVKRRKSLPIPLQLGDRVYLPLEDNSRRAGKGMDYTPLLNLHYCIHNSLWELGIYCMDELFKDLKEPERIIKLLWKHYKEMCIPGTIFDEDNSFEYRIQLQEKRVIQKQLVFELNRRLVMERKKYIQALSEITLFSKLPYLMDDVKRIIVKYLASNRLLTRKHFYHQRWRYYTIIEYDDLDDLFLEGEPKIDFEVCDKSDSFEEYAFL